MKDSVYYYPINIIMYAYTLYIITPYKKELAKGEEESRRYYLLHIMSESLHIMSNFVALALKDKNYNFLALTLFPKKRVAKGRNTSGNYSFLL